MLQRLILKLIFWKLWAYPHTDNYMNEVSMGSYHIAIRTTTFVNGNVHQEGCDDVVWMPFWQAVRATKKLVDGLHNAGRIAMVRLEPELNYKVAIEGFADWAAAYAIRLRLVVLPPKEE
jgi:hypothetical protein